MNNRQIEIAVIGSAGSGKSALVARLNAAQAETKHDDVVIRFDEHHTHEEMDSEHHDAVLQVVDATDLSDSLMLTPSFVDHRHPFIIALTHYDRLRATHHELDIDRFSELIGVPVVIVSPSSDEGISLLLRTIVGQCCPGASALPHPVFHAWKQRDEEAYRAYVDGVLAETLRHPDIDTHPLSERVNRVLTSRWIGFPILCLVLALVFWATFAIGEPLQCLIQRGIDNLYDLTVNSPLAAYPAWCSLLADGIVHGVGTLLAALPNIVVLFFFLSLMEETGYMSRVAYLMDGWMHRIGLHGRSFIPMLIGFNCNVPAIVAAKEISNPKDRALTMLMIPYMSCSARLPVYVLFISIFFPSHKALVLISLYIIGIVLSILFAIVMKRTKWFRQPAANTINELPPFKLPSWRGIAGHLWYRISDYIKKIFTIVLIASVVIWLLEYFPAGDLSAIDSSWLAAFGRVVEPVMRPLGFDWKMSVCLLTGLPAKEAIAVTFASLYSNDWTQVALTPVSAYAFLVFTLLYFPCVATVSTLRKELNWRWGLFTVVHSMILAWIMAFLVQWIGGLL